MITDDWDILLSEDEENEWDNEWICQACEHGPMKADDTKCERCGCKKDAKFRDDGMDYEEDGWGEEKEEVEEIWYP